MDGFRYNFSARRKGKGWQLVMDYKDGMKWRQKTKAGFLTKRDALAYRDTLLEEVSKTISLNPKVSGLTLLQFADMYLAMRKDLAPSTRHEYKHIIGKMHKLNSIPMAEITYVLAQEQLSEFASQKPSTRQRNLIVLKNLLTQAKKYKAIPENPIAEMRRSDIGIDWHPSRPRTFTREEVKYFIDHAVDSRANIIIAICALTGVRVGEALAIRWSDIDFVNSEVSINKQWKIIKIDGSKFTRGFGKVKNKTGARVLHIPPVLMKALLAYKAKAVLYMDGRITNITHPSSVNQIIIKKFPNHSAHDFRHTYATNLLASGMDIQTVAALLGDKVATVENAYIHYTEEMRKSAAEHIDRFFG